MYVIQMWLTNQIKASDQSLPRPVSDVCVYMYVIQMCLTNQIKASDQSLP